MSDPNRDADLDAILEGLPTADGLVGRPAMQELARLCREARNGLAVEEAAGRDLHAEVERLRGALTELLAVLDAWYPHGVSGWLGMRCKSHEQAERLYRAFRQARALAGATEES